jgi:hypothetical protein
VTVSSHWNGRLSRTRPDFENSAMLGKLGELEEHIE